MSRKKRRKDKLSSRNEAHTVTILPENVNLKWVTPSNLENSLFEKHPIIMKIISVELFLGLLALLSYMYVYLYKASFLEYYGIPAYYTEVTIPEMLNSSWLMLVFLEMALYAGYGLISIMTFHLVAHLAVKMTRTKQLLLHVFSQSFCLILFFAILAVFFKATNEAYSIWEMEYEGDFSLGLLLNDMKNLRGSFWLPISIILFRFFLKNRLSDPQRERTKWIIKYLSLAAMILCIFLFSVYAYTDAVALGKAAATTKTDYTFIVENGKITPQMIVGTYQDQYLTVYLTDKRTYLQDQYGTRQPNIIDQKFKLVPILEKEAKSIELVHLKVRSGVIYRSSEMKPAESVLFDKKEMFRK